MCAFVSVCHTEVSGFEFPLFYGQVKLSSFLSCCYYYYNPPPPFFFLPHVDLNCREYGDSGSVEPSYWFMLLALKRGEGNFIYVGLISSCHSKSILLVTL